MPTPPIGDMAWAASPMQSRPGRYQRLRRSTVTVSSFTSSQDAISLTRSANAGLSAGDGGAEGLEPLARAAVEAAFGNDIGALPIVAAVERDEHHAGLDAAERLRRRRRALGEAEPEHVHRRAEILDFESGPLAARRSAGRRRRRPDRL